MIAADRAVSILAPMANINNQRKLVKIFLICTWINSFLFAIPAVSSNLLRYSANNIWLQLLIGGIFWCQISYVLSWRGNVYSMCWFRLDRTKKIEPLLFSHYVFQLYYPFYNNCFFILTCSLGDKLNATKGYTLVKTDHFI